MSRHGPWPGKGRQEAATFVHLLALGLVFHGAPRLHHCRILRRMDEFVAHADAWRTLLNDPPDWAEASAVEISQEQSRHPLSTSARYEFPGSSDTAPGASCFITHCCVLLSFAVFQAC